MKILDDIHQFERVKNVQVFVRLRHREAEESVRRADCERRAKAEAARGDTLNGTGHHVVRADDLRSMSPWQTPSSAT